MPKFIDLTGQKINRWTVLKRAPDKRPGAARWLCRCECGKVADVPGQNLREGESRSCGCYNSEVRARLCIARSTHGMSRTPTHVTWRLMKQRCSDKNFPGYAKYGAKGVRVCPQWESFETFLADMGKKPSAKHSIDRIDARGHYEPSNCRWATMKEQQNNRTNNRRITWRGESLTLVEWAERTGIKRETLGRRLDTLGWPVEEALTRRPSRLPRSSD